MTIEHTYRNYAIASYLVHGHTPWGVHLAHKPIPCLSNCEGRWIMCCGHVLSDDEAWEWIGAGIATIHVEPDKFGRDRLVANGDRTTQWLSECWESLSDGYDMETEAA